MTELTEADIVDTITNEARTALDVLFRNWSAEGVIAALENIQDELRARLRERKRTR